MEGGLARVSERVPLRGVHNSSEQAMKSSHPNLLHQMQRMGLNS
jgi:hypothetical protein